MAPPTPLRLALALATIMAVSTTVSASDASNCTETFNLEIASAGGTLSLVCAAVSELKACVAAVDTADPNLATAKSVLQAAELTNSQCQPVVEEQVFLEQVDKDFVIQVPAGGKARIVRDDQMFDLFQMAASISQLKDQSAKQADLSTLQTRFDTLSSQMTTLINLLTTDPNAADKLSSLVDVRGLAQTVDSHTTAIGTQGGEISSLQSDSGSLANRVSTLEGDVTSVTQRVTTIEQNDNTDIVHQLVDALHAGSDTSADIDVKIQNLLDLDEIQQNANAISTINGQIDSINTALDGKAATSDVRTDTQIRAVVEAMVSQTNALTTAISDPAHVITAVNALLDDDSSELSKSLVADPNTPRMIRCFRFSRGSWTTSSPGYKDVTASNGVDNVNVEGTFFVPTKRKVKYQLHLGGDYVDGGATTVLYRLRCVNGGTVMYFPSTTGHRTRKYVDHSRLESETFDFVTPELDAGQWTCRLQINSASNNKYTWSSSHGEISLIVGDVLHIDPSNPLLDKQIPQQVFRQTTSSVSSTTNGFVNMPGRGTYIHPQNDITVPYYFHVGGHYVNDCGRTVKYRIRCIDAEDHTVYLPDSGGHKIYMYTDNSRLESEMFHGVSSEFRRGVYQCSPQVHGGSCGSYHWSSSYGEIIFGVGAQGNLDQTPQQVYFIDEGVTRSNKNTNWNNYPNAKGNFVQATDQYPVLYTLHTGGDWTDTSDRRLYYRVECKASGKPTVYLPDANGFKIFKYVNQNRLETETFFGVTKDLLKGTYSCQQQWKSESSNPYSWDSVYGDLSLTMW